MRTVNTAKPVQTKLRYILEVHTHRPGLALGLWSKWHTDHHWQQSTPSASSMFPVSPRELSRRLQDPMAATAGAEAYCITRHSTIDATYYIVCQQAMYICGM